MDELNLNLDDINLNDIADTNELPDGEYIVKLMEPKVVMSKAGNRMINYYVIVQEGEYSGRRFYSRWMLTPETIWKMKKDFDKMQYKPQDGKPRLEDIDGFMGVAQVKRRIDKAGEQQIDLLWKGPLV